MGRAYDFADYNALEDNPDFHRRSLRFNLVMRWEYAPGSTRSSGSRTGVATSTTLATPTSSPSPTPAVPSPTRVTTSSSPRSTAGSDCSRRKGSGRSRRSVSLPLLGAAPAAVLAVSGPVRFRKSLA